MIDNPSKEKSLLKRKDITLKMFMFYVMPLCVYLQSLFFATTNIWGASYILILCFLILFSGKFKVDIDNSDIFLFLFCVIACFSSLKAGEYLYFMQFFLVTLFIFGYTKYDLGILYKYLDIILVFGLLCAVACILQVFDFGFYDSIVSKLFKSENYDSILMLEENAGKCGLMPQTSHAAGCILFALYVLFANKTIKKKVFYALILIIGLLLTGKRTHLFLGMLVFFLSYYVGFEGKRKSKKILNSVLVAIVLIGGVVFIAPFLPAENTISKVVNTVKNFDINDAETMHGREILYANAMVLGNSAPLTGHGWGSFKKITDQGTDVHNVFLQLYAEQGIIVMLVFICSFIAVIINNIKTLKLARHVYKESSIEILLLRLSFCFILFFFLYGLTGNSLYNIDFLIIFGLGFSINKRVQNVIKNIE